MNNNTHAYSWNEIVEYVRPVVETCEAIQTFGTIGSHNLEHDVDIFMTKNPKSSLENFFREKWHVFDSVNKYLLDNYGNKAVCFYDVSCQEDVLWIAGYNTGDLALHVMPYESLSQFEGHWLSHFHQKGLEWFLNNNYTPIKGSCSEFFDKEFSGKHKNDFMVKKLYSNDRLNSHFPEELLVSKTNHICRYVLKWLKIDRELVAKTKSEAEENFYKLCTIVDS